MAHTEVSKYRHETRAWLHVYRTRTGRLRYRFDHVSPYTGWLTEGRAETSDGGSMAIPAVAGVVGVKLAEEWANGTTGAVPGSVRVVETYRELGADGIGTFCYRIEWGHGSFARD